MFNHLVVAHPETGDSIFAIEQKSHLEGCISAILWLRPEMIHVTPSWSSLTRITYKVLFTYKGEEGHLRNTLPTFLFIKEIVIVLPQTFHNNEMS